MQGHGAEAGASRHQVPVSSLSRRLDTTTLVKFGKPISALITSRAEQKKSFGIIPNQGEAEMYLEGR